MSTSIFLSVDHFEWGLIDDIDLFAKSLILLSLAVLNGGSICLWYLYVHWSLYILIS